MNRDGQVWKVTNMSGGWTVFVITRSAVGVMPAGGILPEELIHSAMCLDAEGPDSGGPGRPLMTLEDPKKPWEDGVDGRERLW